MGRILGDTNSERALRNALDFMREVFACERAFLSYPCEPIEGTFEVPLESADPAWPGGGAVGGPIPSNPLIDEIQRLIRNTDGPVVIDSSTLLGPQFAAVRALGVLDPRVPRPFDVQALMGIRVIPPIGPMWALGIHHCVKDHVFTPDEVELFDYLGRRIATHASLWVLERRLAKVTSMEALGLMLSETVEDLETLAASVVSELEGSEPKVDRALGQALLVQRLLGRIAQASAGAEAD